MEYAVVEVTLDLLDSAMVLADAHSLRAYDAVQLASVLEVDSDRSAGALPPVTLVSADLELNAAATACRITVEDPNSHP